jgi:hypothetical protein
MLYVPVNANAWKLAWEEIEWLEKKLRRLNFIYQVIVERRMFELQDHPEYRFVLLKWNGVGHKTLPRTREVLLETHDVDHMTSVLKMLISVEGEQ